MKKLFDIHGNEIMVDDNQYDYLSKFSWHISPQGYAKKNKSKSPNGDHGILMHRMVLGAKAGEQVDHIDGNKLNNQLENLRLCSFSSNQANSKIKSNNTSKYKGVTFDSSRNKWIAQIMINRKHKFLGRFNSPIDAAREYNNAAIHYFGEFANINNLEKLND